MAEVFRRVGGRKLTKIIANHEDVQFALGQAAGQIAGRARSVLAAHRYEGDAKIDTARGKVDHYVVLDDTAGLSAAMTIEFGRDGSAGNGWMEPIAPLRTAASIPLSARSIGPRMKGGRFSSRRRRRR